MPPRPALVVPRGGLGDRGAVRGTMPTARRRVGTALQSLILLPLRLCIDDDDDKDVRSESEKSPPHVAEAPAVIPFCRICLSDEDQQKLFAPCRCKGSCLHVHRYCLDQWRLTLQAQGSLLNGEPMRCEACHYIYEIEGSWLTRRIAARVGFLTNLFIITTAIATGLIWHQFSFFHNWVINGDEPDATTTTTVQPPSLQDATMWLASSTCHGHAVLCLPRILVPAIPLLAPLFVLSMVALDGIILGTIVLNAVPRRLSLIFHTIHLLAYVTTGRLLPNHMFDLIRQALIDYHALCESALFTIAVDVHALLLALSQTDLQSPTATTDLDAAYIAKRPEALAFVSSVTGSALAVVARVVVMAVVAAWSYVMKYYYSLILIWSAYRLYDGLSVAFHAFLARRFGVGFKEYSGTR